MSDPLFLDVHYPPGEAQLTSSPEPLYKEGNLVLNCILPEPGHPPASQFRWLQGGAKAFDKTSQTRTWEKVGLTSRANISCLGVNIAGQGVAGTKNIQVLAPPRFLHELPATTSFIESASNVKLSCQVECSPLCQIGWYRNGSCIHNRNSLFSILSEVIPHRFLTNTFESTRSTLVFHLDKWPKGNLDQTEDGVEYTCLSTSNCLGH